MYLGPYLQNPDLLAVARPYIEVEVSENIEALLTSMGYKFVLFWLFPSDFCAITLLLHPILHLIFLLCLLGASMNIRRPFSGTTYSLLKPKIPFMFTSSVAYKRRYFFGNEGERAWVR